MDVSSAMSRFPSPEVDATACREGEIQEIDVFWLN